MTFFDRVTGFVFGIAVWFLLAFAFGLLARPLWEVLKAGWGIWG